MDGASVNWLAVVAAALSNFLIGGLWYGPLLGKTWMRAAGMDEATVAAAPMARTFVLSFALQLLAATVLAFFVAGDTSPAFVIGAAASVGLCWVAPALGVIYLFEQRPLAHWAVNAGYQVVAFTVMGLILAYWR